MHEMSLVRSIVSVVKDEAESAGAAHVSKIYISIGEGRDIVVSLFESMFQYFARGTVAEGAEVVIDHVPYMVRCNNCGTQFHLITVDENTWTCPECGTYNDHTLISGKELYITKIEATRGENAETPQSSSEVV